jgi:hypothetical protein
MGRKKKYEHLTEEELKKERKKYMKNYYRKKKHNIDKDGNYVVPEPKPPKVCPLKITRGEFVVRFD